MEAWGAVMTILERYPTSEKPDRFARGTFSEDESKIYPPLKSEREDLVGYFRTGGCTAGCGACCEAFVVPINREALKHPDFQTIMHDQVILPVANHVRGKDGTKDWEYWLTLHDAWLFQEPDGLLTLTLPIEARGVPEAGFDNWIEWVESHGVTFIQREGKGKALLAYVKKSCEHLQEDGGCGVQGTAKRPAMCAPYPQHPLDVEGIDHCTYKFEAVDKSNLLSLRPVAERQQQKQKPKRKKKPSKKGRR